MFCLQLGEGGVQGFSKVFAWGEAENVCLGVASWHVGRVADVADVVQALFVLLRTAGRGLPGPGTKNTSALETTKSFDKLSPNGNGNTNKALSIQELKPKTPPRPEPKNTPNPTPPPTSKP